MMDTVGNRITATFTYKSDGVSNSALAKTNPSPVPASKPKIGNSMSNSFNEDLILCLFECSTAVFKTGSLKEKSNAHMVGKNLWVLLLLAQPYELAGGFLS